MTQTTQKIPEGWSVKRLDEIGDFISGTGFPEKEQGGIEGVPFYKVSDMNLPENSIYMVKSNNYVTENQIRQMHVKPILKKSILFAKVGAAIFLERKRIAENFLCDNNMMCFSPLIFSLFYKYYFDILRLSKYVQVGALPSYNASDLANIKILLPPLAEQEKIAEILGTWDSAIEKLTALIAAKRLQKKGLIYSYVKKAKDTETFMVSDLFDLGRGKVISKNEIEKKSGIYPVFSSQTSNDGILGYINSFDYDGEFITWTTDGANAGRVFFRKGKFNCTNVCGLASLKKDINLNLYYAMTYLNLVTKYYVSYVGNPKLMNNAFASIPIQLPSINYQNKVSDILSKADEEIDLLTRKLDLIQSQKKGLMQQLLTGKIRVKVA